ncbi:VCBS repeat-containing protein [bacterium]|nr:VCBS repeat-containing protein [bacterium]
MNIRFHVAALFLLTFFLLPSFAFERVEFVPFGPYELEPLNPAHFDGYTHYAPSAFADFNNDKTPDLLSASNHDRAIELFYGIRSSGFEPGRIIYQSNNSYESFKSLVTGDWNRDGLNDFAVLLRDAETLIALNQGNGTFAILHDAYRGLLASSDVDGDGHPDLITLGGGFLMWRLSAPGDWDAVEWRQQTTFDNPVDLHLADYNGDGVIDLGASSNTIQFWVHYGDSEGGFSEAVIILDQHLSNVTIGINIVADLNGDEKTDFATVSFYDDYQQSLDIFLQADDGSLHDAVKYDFPWIWFSDQYAVSDFNVDGYDDVAAVIYNESGEGGRIRVMYGPYQEGFQWVDDLYVTDAEPLGLYAINTLPSGAADLMAVFRDPSEVVYLRWSDLDNPHRFRLPKTLHVPEDALTLSQALQEAIEGDVISMAPGTYADNYQIKDATYVITGRANQALPVITGRWTITNSDCSISLVESKKTTITAQQSNLHLSKTKLTGTTSLRSADYGMQLSNPSRPALVIQDASGQACTFEYCNITGGEVIESSLTPNELNAGAAVLVQDCTNTTLAITTSQFHGGAGGSLPSSRYHVPMQGGPALLLRDSIGVQVLADESSLQGGKGTDVLGYSQGNGYGTLIDPKHGGPGLKAVRSSAVFQSGRIDGGLGGDGGVFRTNIVDETDPTSQSFDGAMGGAGAQAFESSLIIIQSSILNGGPGGDPNGEYGPRTEVDATSNIELINTTDVHNWFLY